MINRGIDELSNYESKYAFFCHLAIRNPQPNPALRGQNGFTLLELLISLTIIGLILVIVFGALRIGARAWEKGEKDVEIHQIQRIVLENMKRQIASTCLRKIVSEDQKEVFFRGDRESMEFMSRLPMVPTTRSGMVYVKYVVGDEVGDEKKRLMLHEKDVVFLEKEKDIDDLDEADFFDLIPRVESIEFEYLKGPEGKDRDPEWQEAWDPDMDTGIPLAVKIIFKEDVDVAPIYVIARLQSEANKK